MLEGITTIGQFDNAVGDACYEPHPPTTALMTEKTLRDVVASCVYTRADQFDLSKQITIASNGHKIKVFRTRDLEDGQLIIL